MRSNRPSSSSSRARSDFQFLLLQLCGRFPPPAGSDRSLPSENRPRKGWHTSSDDGSRRERPAPESLLGHSAVEAAGPAVALVVGAVEILDLRVALIEMKVKVAARSRRRPEARKTCSFPRPSLRRLRILPRFCCTCSKTGSLNDRLVHILEDRPSSHGHSPAAFCSCMTWSRS